jgi:superfamily II DNA or RNA helicase
MRVKVDGYAWLPKKELGEMKIAELRRSLTFTPRRTHIKQDDPQPVSLYRETETHFGMPRSYFLERRKLDYQIELDVAMGHEVNLPFNGELRPDQAVAVDAIERSRMTGGMGGIIQAPPGSGKGHPDDTPILTERGWVRIGDVRIGMKVYGSDGKLHRITGVFNRGVLRTYRVSFTDGTWIDCDGDHLWTVQLRRNGITKPTKTFSTMELMDKGLRDGSGHKFFIPMVKPVDYNQTYDLKIDPYTLGVLLGDGCIRSNGSIEITSPDEDHEIIENLVFPEGIELKYYKYKKRCQGYRLKGAHLGFKLILDEYGLLGKKAHEKFIPKSYLTANVDDRIAILQGLMDTDGSGGPSIEYSTSSEQLAKDVCEIVQSLGGTCHFKCRIINCQTKKGCVNYRLHIKLPDGMQPFRLKRKNDKCNHNRQREPYRAISDISEVDPCEIVCISVDSVDHLYVAKDYIVTHNTVLSLNAFTKIGRSALVIVNRGFLQDQWVKRIKGTSRISGFVPDARVGIIKGKKCQYGDGFDISIAMIQTLAAQKDKLPPEFWNSFGLIINDEVHRISAPSWADIVPRFSASYRIGVSATPRRKDGMEPVFFSHIGMVLHESKVKRVTPKLRRIYTSLQIPQTRSFIPNRAGDEVLKRWLVKSPGRNQLIVDELVMASRAGRKIIVLSERRKHLEILKDMFDAVKPEEVETSFYLGGMKRDDLEKAESADVIFSSYQMTSEAFDVPELDTAFLVSPISDVEQAVGRIMREYGDKLPAVVTDFIDDAIPRFSSMWNKRREFYIKEGMYKPGG